MASRLWWRNKILSFKQEKNHLYGGFFMADRQGLASPQLRSSAKLNAILSSGFRLLSNPFYPGFSSGNPRIYKKKHHKGAVVCKWRIGWEMRTKIRYAAEIFFLCLQKNLSYLFAVIYCCITISFLP